MKQIRNTLMMIVLIAVATQTQAQFKRKAIKRYNPVYRKGHKSLVRDNTYTAIGFSAKAFNYYGDLAPFPSKFSTDISFTKPGFGISVIHRYGPRYTVIGELSYGQIEGSDAKSARSDASGFNYRKERNLSFRNQITELSVLFVFDLFENKSTYLNRVKWTPYAFAGAAVFHHNPQAQAPATYLDGTPDPKAGQWVDLQPLGTEGQHSSLLTSDANYGLKPYSLYQFAIPFGLGVRLKLNDFFDVSSEVGIRYTFTDYLDDVSKNYVNLNRIKDPLAQALSYRSNEIPNKDFSTHTENIAVNGVTSPITLVNGYGSEYPTNIRGNSRRNDIYVITSVRLSYIITRVKSNAKRR